MTRDVRRGRAGFTLIELLVVIAIIAVLVGLLLPAVMKVLGKGPEATAKHEINQLSAAIGAFKTEFGVKYMPSRFVLHETLANYDPSVPGQPGGVSAADLSRSRAFLSMMFGRRLGAQVDWDGNGTIDAAAGAGKVLSGEQCLVFFLGGAQVTTPPYGCLGFSTNPSNPMAPGGTRKGPFYEFKSNRLIPVNGFFVYADAYSTGGGTAKAPYVYLADRSTNDYEENSSTLVRPYRASAAPLRYLNQGGFQILCAGADHVFGSRDLHTTLQGSSDPAGRDDFSNFSRIRLGAPQE